MTKRERVEKTYAFEAVDRFPFVPAVYEHKARLIEKTPSAICRNADLLTESLHRELEVYDPDMLVVGVDVYNVEAEALRCEVRYFEDSGDVPAIVTPLLRGPSDLKKLGYPDPAADGRMPLFVDVAAELNREWGERMIIRGALSGPFSIACALLGTTETLMATVDDPGFVRELIEFSARITVTFGAAFLERGSDIIIFDSKASPAASSPKIFAEYLLPVYRDIVIPELKRAGARYVPLIIGGDTTRILEELLMCGATQLLCDAGADLAVFRRRCGEEKRAFRANVDAQLVHRASPARIREDALRILDRVDGQRGFLFGCGVVAYDCDPAHVLAIREALFEGVGPRQTF